MALRRAALRVRLPLFASRKSLTSVAYATSRSWPRWRRIEEGWIVAIVVGASAQSGTIPCCSVTRKFRPRSALAAVAPRRIRTSGAMWESSSCSQIEQASISLLFGLSWMRRFPRAFHLKCLTAFVMYTAVRSIPAASSASSKSWPAGPTNGSPARSSWSPGCSPTSMIAASGGPEPNTVCVAWAQRPQFLHDRAASAASASVCGAFATRQPVDVPGGWAEMVASSSSVAVISSSEATTLTPTTRSRYASATSSSSRSTVQHADAMTVTLNPFSRASIAVWATQPSVLMPASRIRSIPRSSRTSARGVWSNAEYLGLTMNRSSRVGAIA